MVTCAYNPGVTESEIGRCLGLTGLPAQSIWRSSRATRNFNNQQTYIYQKSHMTVLNFNNQTSF